ncbi:hypothetical protein [Pedobacter chitinilyticus]|uniref:Lipoprotein n=1 Tax=Pedobacter chitinilyticus TaxID=2233776 RepID=A0A3S3PVP0_9SPHI|nr:hypothetical protein [Pedobacter chitinilyticus]RWU10497.1 hypothetical protein DPV69_03940 [Pedobacter chitinilyticus]
MNAKCFCCILIVFIFLAGCRTREVSYRRDKIIKKFKHYKIYLNNRDLIDLDTFYLDKDNVARVIANNQSYRLSIFQKNKKNRFYSLDEVIKSFEKELDTSDSLINIIDGIFIEPLKQKSIKFEQDVVKAVVFIKKEEVWKHLPHAKSGIVLITIKD